MSMRQEQDPDKQPDENVDHVIQLQGVYDGWSVEIFRDGTARNRWPSEDYRSKRTQEWIDTVWNALSWEEKKAHIRDPREPETKADG